MYEKISSHTSNAKETDYKSLQLFTVTAEKTLKASICGEAACWLEHAVSLTIPHSRRDALKP